LGTIADNAGGLDVPDPLWPMWFILSHRLPPKRKKAVR
jgi:hypothetical protein